MPEVDLRPLFGSYVEQAVEQFTPAAFRRGTHCDKLTIDEGGTVHGLVVVDYGEPNPLAPLPPGNWLWEADIRVHWNSYFANATTTTVSVDVGLIHGIVNTEAIKDSVVNFLRSKATDIGSLRPQPINDLRSEWMGSDSWFIRQGGSSAWEEFGNGSPPPWQAKFVQMGTDDQWTYLFDSNRNIWVALGTTEARSRVGEGPWTFLKNGRWAPRLQWEGTDSWLARIELGPQWREFGNGTPPPWSANFVEVGRTHEWVNLFDESRNLWVLLGAAHSLVKAGPAADWIFLKNGHWRGL